MTDTHLSAGDTFNSDSGWTTSEKIGLEAAQLWHGIGSGVLNGAHDRFIEHPVRTAIGAAGSAAVGFGLSVLAYHHPRTAIASGVVMRSALAADLLVRGWQTVRAGIDTWNHPQNYSRNEKFTEKQLGYGIVDYALMGATGAYGYSYANKGISAGKTLALGLEDAFMRGDGDIPKLEISKVFEHPLAKFQAADDSSAARIYAENEPAILQIDVRTGMREGKGTGFVVDGEKGLIGTNWHVGGAGEYVGTITPEGRASSLEFMAGDKHADLAIYRAELRPRKPWKEVEFGDSNSLKGGDDLFGIGHPAGVMQQVLTTGKFSRFLGNEVTIPTGDPPTIARILADIPQLGGSSGTPLFDQSGKVVAILNSGIGNSRAGATSVEHLDALLAAARANEQAIPRRGWLDVETNVGDAADKRIRAPFTVRASVQPRGAASPREDLSQYDNKPPGVETIYSGRFQPYIGIPAAISYVSLLPWFQTHQQ